MSWAILYSSRAKTDLKDIYEYIAFDLLVPEIADNIIRKIMKKISTLDAMPMRHQLRKDEPWHSRGVRYFAVNNYLIHYIPNESMEIVNILRIVYEGRDINQQLSKTTS
jgi:toxin ParE1/3/4